MRPRVVVTGMGVVSPLGGDLDVFADRLLAGVSGVRAIRSFDAASLPTRIAGEVPDVDACAGPLRDRKVTFAVLAARRAMAMASARSMPGGEAGGADASVSMGVGLELFAMEDLVRLFSPGFTLPESFKERIHFMQTPSDICVHAIAHTYGLRRPPLVHVSACAAGTDAIGAAYRLIASGRRRWMLAGGTDSMVNPLGVAGFCALAATSTRNDHPETASRPFDRTRDGFVMGEGSGVLVLERREDAIARGAEIHAEIAGYGNSLDAYGISEPHPEGQGAFLAMSRALADAGVRADEVDAVSAHGTGTPKNDPVETRALKRLLGARAAKVPIYATKSMIGHLISASGAVETIASIVCMKRGKVHPTMNLRNPDPECDLDYVPNHARTHVQRCVLKSSFGFGGHNASIVIRGPEADACS